MVNPYGFGVYPYTEAGDVTRNPAYVLIDATDPNNVTIQEQGIGIDFGYGEFFIRSNGPGKMVGKTITFPAGSSLVVGMRNYNSGQAGWYANDCILVLP